MNWSRIGSWHLKNGYFVPYLDYIQKDLDLRD